MKVDDLILLRRLSYSPRSVSQEHDAFLFFHQPLPLVTSLCLYVMFQFYSPFAKKAENVNSITSSNGERKCIHGVKMAFSWLFFLVAPADSVYPR